MVSEHLCGSAESHEHVFSVGRGAALDCAWKVDAEITVHVWCAVAGFNSGKVHVQHSFRNRKCQMGQRTQTSRNAPTSKGTTGTNLHPCIHMHER